MGGAEAAGEWRGDVHVRRLEGRHVLRRQHDHSVKRPHRQDLAGDGVAVLLIDVALDLAMRFLRLQ